METGKARDIWSDIQRDPEENNITEAKEKDNFNNELMAKNSKYHVGLWDKD